MKWKELPRAHRAFLVLGLTGSLLWCGANFLRDMRLSLPPWGNFLMGVLPNFGAFWACVGLTVVFWPVAFRKPFPDRGLYLLCAGVLGLMVLSEIAHQALFGAAFDGYDLLCSALSCLILLGVYGIVRRDDHGGNL